MVAENEKDPRLQAFAGRFIENARQEFKKAGIQWPEEINFSIVNLHRPLEDSKYLTYIRKARRRGIGAFLIMAHNQGELSIARSISEVLTEEDYFWTKVTEFSRWDRLKGFLQRKYYPTGTATLVVPGYPRNISQAFLRSL